MAGATRVKSRRGGEGKQRWEGGAAGFLGPGYVSTGGTADVGEGLRW